MKDDFDIEREKAEQLSSADDKARAYLRIAAKSRNQRDFDSAWEAALRIDPSIDCDGIHPWDSLHALTDIARARLEIGNVTGLRHIVSKMPKDRNGDKASLFLEIAKATGSSHDLGMARKEAKEVRWHPERLERLLQIAEHAHDPTDFEAIRFIAKDPTHCPCGCNYARAMSLVYLAEITRVDADLIAAQKAANNIRDRYYRTRVLEKIREVRAEFTTE